MSRPLEGLRILDFTHVLAGPFATRVMGDMGADVVKINSSARAVMNDPSSPYHLMWNRNKRSLALDMSMPDARLLARRLADQADIVIDNFSVGVLDRWGLGYEAVSKTNPGAIFLQMSGMGDGGPWSKFVTYAPTIHALCGLTQQTGVPGREDIGVGFSYNDHQAGLHGVVALLAALNARRGTGRGQRIDMSQFEVGVHFAGLALMDYFANNTVAEPVGNTLPYDVAAPHGVYPCAGAASDKIEDERWVAIACMTDAQWQAFKEVLGNPAWATASQLDDAASRLREQPVLDQHICDWTRQHDATAVMQRCQANGVPAGVVQNGVDLAEHDPQLAAANFLQPIADVNPAVGQTWADALPLHFAKTPCTSYNRVREVGEDNEQVLADWLNMSADEVAAADATGALK